MGKRFFSLIPAALCVVSLFGAGRTEAFALPDLPLATPVRVCSSFEEGSLDHACCLQFPSDDIARRCCSVGFSPADEESFACCRENAANGVHPGTPDDPVTCEHEDPITLCETLFPSDDMARRCCEVGFDPADTAAFLCCQENAKNNVHPGTPAAPTACEPPDGDGDGDGDGEGETPDSSEALPEDDALPVTEGLAPGKCLITALDAQQADGVWIGVTKKGTGILLKVEYLLPTGLSGAERVELAQISGPLVAWRDEAAFSLPEHASSRFEWTVQMGRPEKMIGEFIPNASFRVEVSDAQGKSLHQATCQEQAGVHAQGGSSGCSLIR